jgi:hypothetical protein
VSHYVLDGGRLVVAHEGMKASMQGRGSAKVRDFASRTKGQPTVPWRRALRHRQSDTVASRQ